MRPLREVGIELEPTGELSTSTNNFQGNQLGWFPFFMPKLVRKLVQDLYFLVITCTSVSYIHFSIVCRITVSTFAMSSEMSSQYVSGPSLERREHDKDEKIQFFKSNLQRRHRQRGTKTDGTDQQVSTVAAEQGILLAPVRPRMVRKPPPDLHPLGRRTKKRGRMKGQSTSN